MPAPNEPLRAPYPNVIIPGWPRVALHVIHATGANGSVAINAARSSQSVGIAYVSEGLYTISFPAGGTGAVGLVIPGPVETSAIGADDFRVFMVDTDTDNYAAGTCNVAAVATAGGTEALSDVIGDFSFLVFVLLGPGGAV